MQRNTMNWDEMVKMALETWHPGNNPFLHALMGLAGEAGEMIDQYKKHLYKDGYKCSRDDFLDELGDFWYYLRIVSYLKGINLMAGSLQLSTFLYSELDVLVNILAWSSKVLDNYHILQNDISKNLFCNLFRWLLMRLSQLDCTIEELTQLNYDKLLDNKHGY